MRQYVIDAFSDHVFAGNPAAICVMDKWLDDEKMMAITIENNLSETAFAVKEGEKYHLRWFTPGGEIDLCGVFDDEAVVRNMTVDQEKVRALDGLLLHATAPGKEVDCVSRSFAPKCNVPEDPVCGSGHCHIVPYWVQALGKDSLVAYQASRRGGTLYCTQVGERIKMSGKAAVYSVADINID